MADNTNNSSSLKSYVDSATGAVQSAVGSVTGNPSDQVCIPPLISLLVRACYSAPQRVISITFSQNLCFLLHTVPRLTFAFSRLRAMPRRTKRLLRSRSPSESILPLSASDYNRAKPSTSTVGKLGPINVSSAGGVSTDDPRRTQGQYDQTMGSAKEALGGLVGSADLKNAGAQQNASGKGMEAEGQLADFGHGVKDRVHGELALSLFASRT